MRSILIAFLLVLLMFTGANAQRLMTETFNYLDGGLADCAFLDPASTYYPVANNNVSGGIWVNTATATFPGPVLVQTGALTYSGYFLSGLGKKVYLPMVISSSQSTYRTFTASTAVYYSAMVRVDSAYKLGTISSDVNGTVIMGHGSSSSTYRGLLVFNRSEVTPGKIIAGVSFRRDDASTAFATAKELDTMSTFLIVVRTEPQTGICKLWVNPSLSGSEPAADAVCTGVGGPDPLGTTVNRLIFYQRDNKPTSQIGGVCVGTRWEDITNIATLPMIENFEYPDGALTYIAPGQLNGSSVYRPLADSNVCNFSWTSGSASTFNDPLLVQSGALTYPGYTQSGVGKKLFCPNLAASSSNNRGYRSFVSQQTVYYSLMVNLREVTGLSGYPATKGEYLTGLWATGNATNANYRGLLMFQSGSVVGTYRMGVLANQPGSTTSWVATDLNPLTTYLVVVKYERNNPTCKASIWINPDLSGPEPAPNAISDLGAVDPVGGNTDVGRFGIYQRADKPKVDIGGIRIGAIWFDAPLPIQLASFSGTTQSNNRVRLDWGTISEINNFGFYVLRKGEGESQFAELPNSFVAGHGTTNEPQFYSWSDNFILTGSTQYRLKQVDLDGAAHFTEPITVSSPTDVKGTEPIMFKLEQNYPNPFNPSTTIEYTLPSRASVTLKLYDVVGREVMTLVSGIQDGGSHSVRVDASSIASGVYFYRLNTGNITSLKKMVVMR
jgi:hypothetical protein